MTFGNLLKRFKGVRALVVGDLMLDEYVLGRAARISPEAPVMVIRRQSMRHQPGGAANVAANLRALGANVSMVGVVGNDEAGSILLKSLQNSGIDTAGVVTEEDRVTTRKTRVLANHSHQVLRIDHESEHPLSHETEAAVLDCIDRRLDSLDVLVISDYLKGTVTEAIAAKCLDLAHRKGIPVVVNPKPRSLPLYRGATLLSLNRVEAEEALASVRLRDEEALCAAAQIRERCGVDAVLITLGDAGMAVIGAESFVIPALRVEVYDTAGAGDTVVAAAALGLATKGFHSTVFSLASYAAASVVRKVGVVTPSLEDLQTLSTLTAGVSSTAIFPPHHQESYEN